MAAAPPPASSANRDAGGARRPNREARSTPRDTETKGASTPRRSLDRTSVERQPDAPQPIAPVVAEPGHGRASETERARRARTSAHRPRSESSPAAGGHALSSGMGSRARVFDTRADTRGGTAAAALAGTSSERFTSSAESLSTAISVGITGALGVILALVVSRRRRCSSSPAARVRNPDVMPGRSPVRTPERSPRCILRGMPHQDCQERRIRRGVPAVSVRRHREGPQDGLHSSSRRRQAVGGRTL